MKATKKIVGAAAALVAAVALSAGTTFAWFAANTTVSVSGMTVQTKVGSNLLVADASGTGEDAAWKDVTKYTESFSKTMDATVLLPASTVDAQEFFTTSSAMADGTAGTTAYYTLAVADSASTDTTYSSSKMYLKGTGTDSSTKPSLPTEANGTVTPITASEFENGKVWELTATRATGHVVSGTTYFTLSGGVYTVASGLTASQAFTTYTKVPTSNSTGTYHMDYAIMLQAINKNESQAENVALTKAELTYSGTKTDDTEAAWRIGVLTAKASNTTSGATPSTPTAIPTQLTTTSILAMGTTSGDTTTVQSKYFSKTTDNTDSKYMAVSAANALSAVTKLSTAATISGTSEVAKGTTEFYYVVIRLWLEGEDTTCTSATFANLVSNEWTLDLKFELGESKTGITAYTKNSSTT